MTPLPLSVAREHHRAARAARARAREAVGTVERCRCFMEAHQRLLAVRALRRKWPRGTA